MADGHPVGDGSSSVNRTLPWVISLGLHALLIAVAALVPWSTRFFEDEPRPVVRADFEDLTPVAVVVETADSLGDLDSIRRAPSADARSFAPPNPLTAEADSLAPDPSLRPDMPQFAPDTEGPSLQESLDRSFAPRSGGEVGAVSFAGLHGTDARNIAFIVDASGSMLTWLPIVIDELVRSIDRLGPSQRVSVLFFQSNEAVVVPPPGEGWDRRQTRGSRSRPGTPPRGRIPMLPATDEVKVHIAEWIDLDEGNLRARGQSNPIEAIRIALERLDPTPDVIFILSTDITGVGDYEVDQSDLLSMISRLNRGPRGSLKSTIKTIQFVEPDALGTLRRIAETNGGIEGYRYISRSDLGIDRNAP